MQTFRNASDVRLVVPLLDADGNELSVTSISYRVTDHAGVQVIALTPLADFVSLSPEAVISIPAASNTLTDGQVRDLRAVELHCVNEGNTIVLQTSYSIELAEVLTAGLNSFQSLVQAEFNATQVASIPGWDAATRQQRVNALIEARLRICRLSFMPLTGNRLWGQDSLNFVPEGSYPTNYVGGGMVFGGDLSEVPPAQFDRLPEALRAALNIAQIVEANAILGGEPLEEKRQGGVMLDTVGESKMMFRDERPLQLPVCRRALGYLSKYITFAKVLGR